MPLLLTSTDAGVLANRFPRDVALLALTFVLVATLLPRLMQLAHRWGLVDCPDGHRKLQRRPIPLAGGVAIFSASILTLIVAFITGMPDCRDVFDHAIFLTGLAGAAGLVFVVGLVDDRYEIRGRQKLIAQILAVGIIAFTGPRIDRISALGHEVELGILSVPLTMVWLLGAINAVNLIDGVDGLAGTVCAILAITIGTLAEWAGRSHDAAFAWLIAGGLLGFLVHNRYPASVYLGDAGSMTVGLVLGVLAIRVSLKEAATLGLAVPMVIWAVLFFDVAMAVLRRTLTGQSIYATDRAHMHHVLLRHGYSVTEVVGIIGSATLLCCGGVLAGHWLHSEMLPLAVGVGTLSILVLSGLFGSSEMALLMRRVVQLALSFARMPHHEAGPHQPITSRFHGIRAWEDLWRELVVYAERFDLCTLQLNVSAPALGEEYHARWERRNHENLRSSWRSEIPLFVGQTAVGRLVVSGMMIGGDSLDGMCELMSGLRPFQYQMEALLVGNAHFINVDTATETEALTAPNYVAIV